MKNNGIYCFIKSNLFFLLLLITIVFSLYGKSINFKFTNHDDITLINNNINYLSQWKNIPSLFTTSVYISKNYFYYRPILTLSFSIESILFYDNPKIYHLTNIIFFILALYLMYVFLSKLNLNKTILKLLIILFSVHPILTSSVVWIPARNDTLLAIFVFLSFIFFIKYLETNKTKNLILYILFWIISLFTKETAILFLFLYPLFLYCFDYNFNKKNFIKNSFIFIFILIIYFYLRKISVQTVNINEHLIFFKDYLNNVIYGYAFFIYNFFNFFDIPIMADSITINNNLYLISYIFLFLALYIVYSKRLVSFKILLFSLVWFFIWIFPTFLFLKNNYLLFFHRILIPLLSIIILSCNLLEKIYFKYKKQFLIIYIFLFGFLFCNSSLQANKYSTPKIYIENSKKYAFNSPIIQSVIVQDYMYKKDFDNALEILKQIIKEYPNFIQGKLIMAQILYQQGKIKESIELYKKIEDMTKENRYICYKELSKIYMEQNQLDESLFYGEQAYNLKPHNIEVSENLAIIYARIGQYNKAIDILLHLLSFDKKNIQYMYNLSLLYKAEGNMVKSVEYAKLALQEEPYDDEYKQYLQKLTNEKNNI